MIELQRDQRRVLVETLSEFGNIADGALVFGQALSDRVFSIRLAALGFALWVLIVGTSVVLAGRSES